MRVSYPRLHALPVPVAFAGRAPNRSRSVGGNGIKSLYSNMRSDALRQCHQTANLLLLSSDTEDLPAANVLAPEPLWANLRTVLPAAECRQSALCAPPECQSRLDFQNTSGPLLR